MAWTTPLQTISTVLATTLAAMPVQPAFAARARIEVAPQAEPSPRDMDPPTEGEPAPAEGGEADPEGAEGEPAEEAPPEPEPEPEPEPQVEPEPPPPPVATGPERPEEPRVGGKPLTGKGLMIAGGTLLGVGIVSIITAAMLTKGCDLDGPLQCKYQDQDTFLIPLATAPAILGAVLLGVGAGYYARYRRWERWTPEQAKGKRTAFAPFVHRAGAGLVLSGRF